MGNLTMFGKTYETVGSTSGNLLLRTKGDLKIQWGNKFIDLVKDGRINAENKSIDIPAGIIVLYSGEEIPEGWLLCDGENDTPDLQEAFIKKTQEDGTEIVVASYIIKM